MNHGDLDNVAPSEYPDSVTDVGTIYYYTSLKEVNGLVHLCLSMLSQGVHCEMGRITCLPRGEIIGRGNQMVAKGSGGGGWAAVDEVISSMTLKNIAQQKQATMEMIAHAQEKIVMKEDRKKKAVTELAEKLGGNKKKVRIIVKHRKYKIAYKYGSDVDIDSDSKIITEMQGKLVESYIAAGEHLSFLVKQRESLMKDMPS